MAGNALTEALVFGARAGKAASLWACHIAPQRGKNALEKILSSLSQDQRTGSPSGSVELKKRLKKILWENGGIIRNKEGLTRAIEAARQILDEAQHLSLKTNPSEVQNILELQFGSKTAILILEAALRRGESRGAHFREDFPAENDSQWRGHLEVSLVHGEPAWSFIAS
jgi:succinate dehydrogenase/fumarate reductase flavoprotein subunit